LATQNTSGKVNVLGGISDFIILILLLAGAGFGGYYYGTHQQMAPVEKVPPGRPGAITATPAAPRVIPTAAVSTATSPASAPPASTAETAQSTPSAAPTSPASDSKQKSKPLKYWLASSGEDYTGYSITVSVNGNVVDNFFGPGKNVDVTRHVKAGDNTVLFDAKALGEQYNKHKGDAKADLTVELVCGPHIQDNYKKSDVLLSYTRNSAEDEDFSDTKHFAKK
jgi:hypothetical protein